MATLPPVMSTGTDGIEPELRRRIEEHAYSLWEADGRPDGRALEYWLRAEQAVLDQPVLEAPRRKGARAPRNRAPEGRLPTS
jgi:Protein of unknown function (DUF2934)